VPLTTAPRLSLCLLAIVALASTVVLSASASGSPAKAEVRISGSTLVITAAPGARDNLEIARPGPPTVRVTNVPGDYYRGSKVEAGAGCTPSGPYAADCESAIARIRVVAGDQRDRVTNFTGVRSWMYGGSGNDSLSANTANDSLYGGPGVDTLLGGRGADVLQGAGGDDLILARDQTLDAQIDCGAGTADRADLDKLPKDPNPIVTGCETKTRR
jgi:hypothetical protein